MMSNSSLFTSGEQAHLNSFRISGNSVSWHIDLYRLHESTKSCHSPSVQFCLMAGRSGLALFLLFVLVGGAAAAVAFDASRLC